MACDGEIIECLHGFPERVEGMAAHSTGSVVGGFIMDNVGTAHICDVHVARKRSGGPSGDQPSVRINSRPIVPVAPGGKINTPILATMLEGGAANDRQARSDAAHL